ncbi:MAG: hypothetical protein SGPRY_000264 [Prymnesium sp.]
MQDDDPSLYAEAAGFAGTPPSSEEESTPHLDGALLLTSLSALRLPPPPRPHSNPSLSLPSLITQEDVLRLYDEGAQRCHTLLISFAGSGTHAHEFVGAASRAGVTHALFVRDREEMWYLRAPTEDGDLASSERWYDAVIGLVTGELERLCPHRVITIGASMGGYAAIRVGIAVGAAVVVAFGAQVVLEPEERALVELPAAFYDCKLRQMQSRGVRMQSLTSALEAQKKEYRQQRTLLELHVGGNCSGDVTEAALLQAAATSASYHVDVNVTVKHSRLFVGLRARASHTKAMLKQLKQARQAIV